MIHHAKEKTGLDFYLWITIHVHKIFFKKKFRTLDLLQNLSRTCQQVFLVYQSSSIFYADILYSTLQVRAISRTLKKAPYKSEISDPELFCTKKHKKHTDIYSWNAKFVNFLSLSISFFFIWITFGDIPKFLCVFVKLLYLYYKLFQVSCDSAYFRSSCKVWKSHIFIFIYLP